MRGFIFTFVLLILHSFSSFGGQIHVLAAEGRWQEVKALIANGANPNEVDENGQTVYEIAKIRGESHLIESLPPAYNSVQSYLHNPYRPEQVYMKSDHVQPSAPRNLVNSEAAELQTQMADRIFEELENYKTRVASFADEVEKVQFVQKHRGHIQQLSNNLRFHLKSAFQLSGRISELEGMSLLDVETSFNNDGSRLVSKVVTKGYCTRSSCNRALTSSCWAENGFECMHCGAGCGEINDNCCFGYLFSFGLFSVPVAVVGAALTIAQGAAVAACLPCFCKWEPADRKFVGQIDVRSETELESFVGQMRVIRARLGNTNN